MFASITLHHIHTYIEDNASAIQPVLGRLTSKFGMRLHPIHKEWRSHDGIDITILKGTDIQNVMDGKVVFAGLKGGYGKNCDLSSNMIVVENLSMHTVIKSMCTLW